MGKHQYLYWTVARLDVDADELGGVEPDRPKMSRGAKKLAEKLAKQGKKTTTPEKMDDDDE